MAVGTTQTVRATQGFAEDTAMPSLGGILVTDAAQRTAGLQNYTEKSNFRRLTFDQESVREGDVYFQPNQLIESGTQAFPPISNGQPITLIHDAIFPNGQIFTIVGTPTDIFVYITLDGFDVYEIGPDVISVNNTSNAFVIPGNWAAEFPAAKEFRVLRSIYNNGKYTVSAGGATYIGGTTDETSIIVDEPIPFAVPDGVIVAPVYGNAITVIDTIGDVFSIDGDHTGAFLDTNTFYIVGSTGNDSKYTVSGNSVFSAGKTLITVLDEIPSGTVDGFILPVYDVLPAWLQIATDLEVGHRWEVFNNDVYVVFNNGKNLPFTWVNGASSVTPIHELREQGVGAVETITEYNGMILGADILEIPSDDLADIMNGIDPYGVYDDEVVGNRVRYKIIYSPIAEPRRWGVIILGTIGAASTTLTLEFPSADWVVGTNLSIAGAGTLGGVLTANIVSIAGSVITLDAPSVGAVTDAAVFQTSDDTLGPQPGGSYDLQDDNSGILRMLSLRGTLVVYKDTAILIGSYTGDFENPFQFEAVYHGDNTPFWRWTLVRVTDQMHVFASKDNFYSFDLSSRVPKIMPTLTFCRNLFFDEVTLEIAEQIYASVNEMTDEVWFNFPDNALAYDYKYNSCSLVGRYYSGSKNILRPRESRSRRSEERWFVGGRSDGRVMLYALVTLKQGATGNAFRQYGNGGKYTNFVQLYQMGNTVYSDGDFFVSTDVGSTIIWDSGERAIITTLVDEFIVEVDRVQEVPAGKAFLWESLYDATIVSGWADFGRPADDKDVQSYMLELSSESGVPETQIQIYANNHPRTDGELVVDEILDDIGENPLIPLLLRDGYFKDKVILTDQIDPLIFTARTYDIKFTDSRRITRI